MSSSNQFRKHLLGSISERVFSRVCGASMLPAKLGKSSGITRRTLASIAIGSLVASGIAQAQGIGVLTAGRQRYIASAGSDSNPGTVASPWQTIAKVNAQMMIAGDTFHFNGGDTFTDATLTPVAGGAAGAGSVKFTSYGTGLATISLSAASAVSITNLSYVTIDSLICTGATGTTQGGISTTNTGQNSNIVISNCIVSGFAGNGIEFNSTGTGILTNTYVLNCTTHDNTGAKITTAGSSGIYFKGTYAAQFTGIYNYNGITVSNCVSYNNSGINGTSNWVGSGIFASACQNATVINCTAYNNGTNNNCPIGGPVGIFFADAKNSFMISCESYLNKTNFGTLGLDGDGFDLDGGCIGCIIEYCYAHDNYGDGFLVFSYTDGTVTANTGSIVRFCVAEKNAVNTKDHNADINLSNISATLSGVQVYNNTVYSNSLTVAASCLTLSGAMTATLINNIFYAASGTFILTETGSGAGITMSGNDYWTPGAFKLIWNLVTYTSLSAWQSATSQDSLGLNVDPMLTSPGNGGTIGPGNSLLTLSAYKLLPGSPMIKAGQPYATYSITPGTRDFYNNTLGTPSIGAHCP